MQRINMVEIITRAAGELSDLIGMENKRRPIDDQLDYQSCGELQDIAVELNSSRYAKPAAWLDPDAGKAITVAEKEAADTRQRCGSTAIPCRCIDNREK